MERSAKKTQKDWRISVGKTWRRLVTGSIPSSQRSIPDPILVGDHPAMDLLNTIVRVKGGLIDILQSDEDVLRWLVLTGFLEQKPIAQFRLGALLAATRTLRDVVRTLVLARKANKRLDLAPLNRLLAKGSSHEELVRTKYGGLKVVRRHNFTTPEALLTPLAESAAELLATANFNLIRACEGTDCVLWFYDRTKAHRRRWCSMQTCGNRNKVSKFRSQL
jgi:predicted RNA-binding Zn ribbon-like protein